jgi:hypothetical protein
MSNQLQSLKTTLQDIRATILNGDFRTPADLEFSQVLYDQTINNIFPDQTSNRKYYIGKCYIDGNYSKGVDRTKELLLINMLLAQVEAMEKGNRQQAYNIPQNLQESIKAYQADQSRRQQVHDTIVASVNAFINQHRDVLATTPSPDNISQTAQQLAASVTSQPDPHLAATSATTRQAASILGQHQSELNLTPEQQSSVQNHLQQLLRQLSDPTQLQVETTIQQALTATLNPSTTNQQNIIENIAQTAAPLYHNTRTNLEESHLTVTSPQLANDWLAHNLNHTLFNDQLESDSLSYLNLQDSLRANQIQLYNQIQPNSSILPSPPSTPPDSHHPLPPQPTPPPTPAEDTTKPSSAATAINPYTIAISSSILAQPNISSQIPPRLIPQLQNQLQAIQDNSTYNDNDKVDRTTQYLNSFLRQNTNLSPSQASSLSRQAQQQASFALQTYQNQFNQSLSPSTVSLISAALAVLPPETAPTTRAKLVQDIATQAEPVAQQLSNHQLTNTQAQASYQQIVTSNLLTNLQDLPLQTASQLSIAASSLSQQVTNSTSNTTFRNDFATPTRQVDRLVNTLAQTTSLTAEESEALRTRLLSQLHHQPSGSITAPNEVFNTTNIVEQLQSVNPALVTTTTTQTIPATIIAATLANTHLQSTTSQRLLSDSLARDLNSIQQDLHQGTITNATASLRSHQAITDNLLRHNATSNPEQASQIARQALVAQKIPASSATNHDPQQLDPILVTSAALISAANITDPQEKTTLAREVRNTLTPLINRLQAQQIEQAQFQQQAQDRLSSLLQTQGHINNSETAQNTASQVLQASQIASDTVFLEPKLADLIQSSLATAAVSTPLPNPPPLSISSQISSAYRDWQKSQSIQSTSQQISQYQDILKLPESQKAELVSMAKLTLDSITPNPTPAQVETALEQSFTAILKPQSNQQLNAIRSIAQASAQHFEKQPLNSNTQALIDNIIQDGIRNSLNPEIVTNNILRTTGLPSEIEVSTYVKNVYDTQQQHLQQYTNHLVAEVSTGNLNASQATSLLQNNLDTDPVLQAHQPQILKQIEVATSIANSRRFQDRQFDIPDTSPTEPQILDELRTQARQNIRNQVDSLFDENNLAAPLNSQSLSSDTSTLAASLIKSASIQDSSAKQNAFERLSQQINQISQDQNSNNAEKTTLIKKAYESVLTDFTNLNPDQVSSQSHNVINQISKDQFVNQLEQDLILQASKATNKDQRQLAILGALSNAFDNTTSSNLAKPNNSKSTPDLSTISTILSSDPSLQIVTTRESLIPYRNRALLTKAKQYSQPNSLTSAEYSELTANLKNSFSTSELDNSSPLTQNMRANIIVNDLLLYVDNHFSPTPQERQQISNDLLTVVKDHLLGDDASNIGTLTPQISRYLTSRYGAQGGLGLSIASATLPILTKNDLVSNIDQSLLLIELHPNEAIGATTTARHPTLNPSDKSYIIAQNITTAIQEKYQLDQNQTLDSSEQDQLRRDLLARINFALGSLPPNQDLTTQRNQLVHTVEEFLNEHRLLKKFNNKKLNLARTNILPEPKTTSSHDAALSEKASVQSNYLLESQVSFESILQAISPTINTNTRDALAEELTKRLLGEVRILPLVDQNGTPTEEVEVVKKGMLEEAKLFTADQRKTIYDLAQIYNVALTQGNLELAAKAEQELDNFFQSHSCALEANLALSLLEQLRGSDDPEISKLFAKGQVSIHDLLQVDNSLNGLSSEDKSQYLEALQKELQDRFGDNISLNDKVSIEVAIYILIQNQPGGLQTLLKQANLEALAALNGHQLRQMTPKELEAFFQLAVADAQKKSKIIQANSKNPQTLLDQIRNAKAKDQIIPSGPSFNKLIDSKNAFSRTFAFTFSAASMALPGSSGKGQAENILRTAVSLPANYAISHTSTLFNNWRRKNPHDVGWFWTQAAIGGNTNTQEQVLRLGVYNIGKLLGHRSESELQLFFDFITGNDALPKNIPKGLRAKLNTYRYLLRGLKEYRHNTPAWLQKYFDANTAFNKSTSGKLSNDFITQVVLQGDIQGYLLNTSGRLVQGSVNLILTRAFSKHFQYIPGTGVVYLPIYNAKIKIMDWVHYKQFQAYLIVRHALAKASRVAYEGLILEPYKIATGFAKTTFSNLSIKFLGAKRINAMQLASKKFQDSIKQRFSNIKNAIKSKINNSLIKLFGKTKTKAIKVATRTLGRGIKKVGKFILGKGILWLLALIPTGITQILGAIGAVDTFLSNIPIFGAIYRFIKGLILRPIYKAIQLLTFLAGWFLWNTARLLIQPIIWLYKLGAGLSTTLSWIRGLFSAPAAGFSFSGVGLSSWVSTGISSIFGGFRFINAANSLATTLNISGLVAAGSGLWTTFISAVGGTIPIVAGALIVGFPALTLIVDMATTAALNQGPDELAGTANDVRIIRQNPLKMSKTTSTDQLPTNDTSTPITFTINVTTPACDKILTITDNLPDNATLIPGSFSSTYQSENIETIINPTEPTGDTLSWQVVFLDDQFSGPCTVFSGSGSSDLTNTNSATASEINSILAGHNLQGYGEFIVEQANRTGVNPLLAVGILGYESEWGDTGIGRPPSGDGGCYNPAGFRSWPSSASIPRTGSPTCQSAKFNLFWRFEDYDTPITVLFDLAQDYIYNDGITTIEEFANTYIPIGEATANNANCPFTDTYRVESDNPNSPFPSDTGSCITSQGLNSNWKWEVACTITERKNCRPPNRWNLDRYRQFRLSEEAGAAASELVDITLEYQVLSNGQEGCVRNNAAASIGSGTNILGSRASAVTTIGNAECRTGSGLYCNTDPTSLSPAEIISGLRQTNIYLESSITYPPARFFNKQELDAIWNLTCRLTQSPTFMSMLMANNSGVEIQKVSCNYGPSDFIECPNAPEHRAYWKGINSNSINPGAQLTLITDKMDGVDTQLFIHLVAHELGHVAQFSGGQPETNPAYQQYQTVFQYNKPVSNYACSYTDQGVRAIENHAESIGFYTTNGESYSQYFGNSKDFSIDTTFTANGTQCSRGSFTLPGREYYNVLRDYFFDGVEFENNNL